MGYIKHTKKDDWGITIMFMAENGLAFARMYWFYDDLKVVYLDWLSVDEKIRKRGVGLELQLIREKTAIDLGANKSVLWVKENTWQHEWYRRRGYVFLKTYEKENAIWMEKHLNSDTCTHVRKEILIEDDAIFKICRKCGVKY